MTGNGETTNPTESGTNNTNIGKVKESINKFWKNLNSIAKEYYNLWEDIDNIMPGGILNGGNNFVSIDNKNDNINQRFINITKKYVEIFHKGILPLEKELNKYNNLSLKKEISETLGGTSQGNTSENITEEIKILIKQLKEQAFDKYLKYEYNNETGKIEGIYIKLPPSDFEHETTENLENIDFGNRDFNYVTELFFLGSTLNRVKNNHKDLINLLPNESESSKEGT